MRSATSLLNHPLEGSFDRSDHGQALIGLGAQHFFGLLHDLDHGFQGADISVLDGQARLNQSRRSGDHETFSVFDLEHVEIGPDGEVSLVPVKVDEF